MVDEELFIQRAETVDNPYEDFCVHLWAFCKQSGTQDYVYEFIGKNPGVSTDDVWNFHEWLEDRIEDGDIEPIW